MHPEYFPQTLTALAFVGFCSKFLYDIINGSRGLPSAMRQEQCAPNALAHVAQQHVNHWVNNDAHDFLTAATRGGRQHTLRSLSRVSPTGLRVQLTYGFVIDTHHPACTVAVVLGTTCFILTFLDCVRLVAASTTPLLSYMAMIASISTAIYYLILLVRWGFITEPSVVRSIFNLET